MKRTIPYISGLGFLCLMLIAVMSFSQEEQIVPAKPEGKNIFLNAKCNVCHSIRTEEIKTIAGTYVTSKEPNIPPDLSGVGSKYSAEWIEKYLKNRALREGVPHARRFRGTDQELEVLAKWLSELKLVD